MTDKQKKMLVRILATFLLFAGLLAGEKTGALPWLSMFPAGFGAYLVPYLLIGYDIIWKAARNIRHGQVFDENFLMMIATFGAFGVGEYSEALAVMLFYQVGELFQNYAVSRSRQSITEMMNICPEYANLEEDGRLIQVDPDDVEPGMVIVVKAGERIPLDGTVIEGESMIDTAALTGESVPRRAAAGDEVISGCVNGSGTLKVQVSKAFEDSTVAKILELVENAGSKKAKVENFITRFARYYTPVVTVGAAVLAVVLPLVFSGSWGEWVQRACIFLVISCPCALVISVPLGFFGGIGAASKIGVLVKGSNFLEAVAEMTTIVFDKTGTLTKGEFKVAKVVAAGRGEEEVLRLAALRPGQRGLLPLHEPHSPLSRPGGASHAARGPHAASRALRPGGGGPALDRRALLGHGAGGRHGGPGIPRAEDGGVPAGLYGPGLLGRGERGGQLVPLRAPRLHGRGGAAGAGPRRGVLRLRPGAPYAHRGGERSVVALGPTHSRGAEDGRSGHADPGVCPGRREVLRVARFTGPIAVFSARIRR